MRHSRTAFRNALLNRRQQRTLDKAEPCRDEPCQCQTERGMSDEDRRWEPLRKLQSQKAYS